MGLAVRPRSSPPQKEVGLTCSPSGWGAQGQQVHVGPEQLQHGLAQTAQGDLTELVTCDLSSSRHSHRALRHRGGLP